ncbi:histone-lysine N-methyltransferase PRDM9-like [Neocloeon triangulifer]|uniref:histone-lysine N-methyltransferase PRDM9-like n=1 Tax=Neocloeon triangulifer TaxID=2078957 RepID=UPI00286F109A|nr:histone-lysine N-methyltransferase PRDM9-like [Neocloeon triangulifer]
MSLNFPTYTANFGGHHQLHQQVIKSSQQTDYATNNTPSMLTEMTSKYPVDESDDLVDSKYMTSELTHTVYLEGPNTPNRQYSMMNEDADEQNKNQLRSQQDSRTSNSGNNSSVTWQGLVTPGVADYLARLPIGLHHFLKLSTDGGGSTRDVGQVLNQQGSVKKKGSAKSKVQVKQQQQFRPKVEKSKSFEIRLTTALDGSTLFCCPECQLAYPEKELLERHIQSHKLDRKFVCDICGAGLKRKDHLTRHKQSHNADRPYVCNICMKAFKRKEHLNLHFVMHSGEKTHICPECGKGFYCKDHLDRHKQGHNPDRPYVCAVCMKGFKRNEHLARHSIIHSGEKSQVCPECGKSFYRKDHLRKHLRSHVAKRVKTEQSPPTPNQATVASLAAMVSMGSTLQNVNLEGATLSLLSAPV